jgi:rhamnose transport system permease protein
MTRANRSLLMTFLRVREFGVIIALVAVVAFFMLETTAFTSPRNLSNLAVQVAIVIIVAVGQLMVILTRSIDLSVGSVVGLTAFICVNALSAYPDAHWLVISALALGVGVVCGAINGLLVTVGNIPPIIATLATLSIFRGIVFHFSSGRTISVYELSQTPLLSFSSLNLLGVPSLAVVALVVAILGGVVLRWTHFGRDFYAIGSNPDAARYAGIPTRQRIILAYLLCGLLAGLGGLMFTSRFAAVTPSSASGFEFVVIAAVVLGGAGLNGGSGTVLGVVLGAILLKSIENGLTLLRISEFWRFTLQGAVIVLAVALDSSITQRLQERLKRMRQRELLESRQKEAAGT